jgi:hypothetical protein
MNKNIGIEKVINEFTTIITPKDHFFIPKEIVEIGDKFYRNYSWLTINAYYLNLIFDNPCMKADYFCRENDKERKQKLEKEAEELENKAKEIRERLNEL